MSAMMSKIVRSNAYLADISPAAPTFSTTLRTGLLSTSLLPLLPAPAGRHGTQQSEPSLVSARLPRRPWRPLFSCRMAMPQPTVAQPVQFLPDVPTILLESARSMSFFFPHGLVVPPTDYMGGSRVRPTARHSKNSDAEIAGRRHGNLRIPCFGITTPSRSPPSLAHFTTSSYQGLTLGHSRAFEAALWLTPLFETPPNPGFSH